MNELECKRMLTIAKRVRNVDKKWAAEDDQVRILAQLAISAYEEIGRLKADKIMLIDKLRTRPPGAGGKAHSQGSPAQER